MKIGGKKVREIALADMLLAYSLIALGVLVLLAISGIYTPMTASGLDFEARTPFRTVISQTVNAMECSRTPAGESAGLIENGTMYMWYRTCNAWEGTNASIIYAESKDGITFTNKDWTNLNRSNGDYYFPYVIKANDTYNMFVRNSAVGTGIFRYESSDKITWSQVCDGAVITDAVYALNPAVYYDNVSNVWEMLLESGALAPGGVYSPIGYYNSTDGCNYTAYPKNPLSVFGNRTGNPDIKKENGVYVVYAWNRTHNNIFWANGTDLTDLTFQSVIMDNTVDPNIVIPDNLAEWEHTYYLYHNGAGGIVVNAAWESTNLTFAQAHRISGEEASHNAPITISNVSIDGKTSPVYDAHSQS
ncbi:MAG: hypothetical protein ABIH83_06125 [Candidatus Micrarchaeota archaeon]